MLYASKGDERTAGSGKWYAAKAGRQAHGIHRPLKILIATAGVLRSAIAHYLIREMRMTRCLRLLLVLSFGISGHCWGSDHLDTPAVIEDPRTDIGDVYAWTSPDHQQLNLVMTIVGHTFSSKVAYVFHIDSGRKLGATTATTDIVCRFASAREADCVVGKDADHAHGDASESGGLQGIQHLVRVFAGLRDDPLFNNVL